MHQPTRKTRPAGRRVLLIGATLAGLVMAAPAIAQTAAYPDKPLRIVIPYAPGGGADGAARLVAEALGKALGQTVLVESKPGGNTMIATQQVARAPADGYTLLMTGGSTMSVLPLVSDKLPVDPVRDLVPIGMVSRFPFIVAAASDFGVNTLAEALAKAREKPGAVAYASNGNAGMVHMGMEWLAHAAGVQLLHVPYKGFAPAISDVVTGRTPLMMADWAPIAGSVQAGKLKLLAVTSAQRYAQLPDVPTVAEQGFPGYNLDIWFALHAPAGTPPAVVARLNEALTRWQRTDEARAAFKRIGHESAPSTPDEVRDRVAQERKAFAEVVKRAQINAD
jgi:tripartite-type tricarboxylate transporter receptor subunit TctC